MKKYSWTLVTGTLLVFLGFFNHGVYQKEQLSLHGRLVLMELAPVDPRSLIQGDYMRLDYALYRSLEADSLPAKGLAALAIDANGLAFGLRILENLERPRKGEIPIKYSKRGWRGIQIGAESYFFQEGKAGNYGAAKYGGIKVDSLGNSLLVGLFDENLQQIE